MRLFIAVLIIAVFLPGFPAAAITYTQIDTGYLGLKKNIEANLREPKPPLSGSIAAITPHHLPTALPLISALFNTISAGRHTTFVVIGPDHKELCSHHITTALHAYRTPFGILGLDQELIKDLRQAGVSIDNKCLADEHAFQIPALFIKKIRPEARIITLAISASARPGELDKIISWLDRQKNIYVIGSVDFSHYLPYQSAMKQDRKTAKKISTLHPKYQREETDSPPTLYIIANYAKNKKAEAKIIEIKNSFHYDGNSNHTTGYISAIFTNNRSAVKY